MDKLGYKLSRIDSRSGRVYTSKENSQDEIWLYGGISGVPNKQELNTSDIVGEVLGGNGMRTPENTKYINETLGLKVPTKEFDFMDYEFDSYETEGLKGLESYIKNYKAISYEEYKEVKTAIKFVIRKRTNISIDKGFNIEGKLTQTGNGIILMIDGKVKQRRGKLLKSKTN